MDGVAVRDAGFRGRLFEETGSQMNMDPLIVEKDFNNMQIMIFGDSQSFKEIMDILSELESTINSR